MAHTKYSKDAVTTIKLSVGTREKLSDLGKKGDTYEDIILRLLKEKG